MRAPGLTAIGLVLACGGSPSAAESTAAPRAVSDTPPPARDEPNADADAEDGSAPASSETTTGPETEPHTQPPTQPEPDPERRRSYDRKLLQAKRALDRGRKRSKAGRTDEALEHFDRALALIPDYASAACEAGFAALDAKRWTVAEAYLRKGVRFAEEPRTVGACYYNLALVELATHRRTDALRSLRLSYWARKNATVARKLGELTGGEELCIGAPDIFEPTEPACGLPRLLWDEACSDGPASATKARDVFRIDSGETGEFRIVGLEYPSDTRHPYGLIFVPDDMNGPPGEAGIWFNGVAAWETRHYEDSTIESVTMELLDSDLRAHSAALFTIVSEWENININVEAWDEACDERGLDLDACMEIEDEFDAPESGTVTHYVACHLFDSRFHCAPVRAKPDSVASIAALFRCPT